MEGRCPAALPALGTNDCLESPGFQAKVLAAIQALKLIRQESPAEAHGPRLRAAPAGLGNVTR